MKKINFTKTLILLLTVFAFSMCEENGPIQFLLVDEFSTSVPVRGLQGQSSLSLSSSTDISQLLDNASSFLEADVESVFIEIENYSDNSINGNIEVLAGSISLLNETLTLSSSPKEVKIPSSASNILSIISSSQFPVKLNGSLSTPIADNDFSIKLTFKVRAKVQ